ncbi:MAG: ribosomal protein [Parcubacteria group bacterium]|nr:ribosomal protein [Parcubacteria group bacterium]
MSKATRGKQTAKFKIKKGDQVMVVSGKDKGKTGPVLRVIPEDAMVVVDGVAIVRRHLKNPVRGQVGRIAERPRAIHISNVMLMDPEQKKPTRVKREMRDGKKVRVAVKSSSKLG